MIAKALFLPPSFFPRFTHRNRPTNPFFPLLSVAAAGRAARKNGVNAGKEERERVTSKKGGGLKSSSYFVLLPPLPYPPSSPSSSLRLEEGEEKGPKPDLFCGRGKKGGQRTDGGCNHERAAGGRKGSFRRANFVGGQGRRKKGTIFFSRRGSGFSAKVQGRWEWH